jgi:nucleotide-binding universal stress UspA family protein
MKILICTDGSDQAENAIRFGGLIASAVGAETTLLGITEHDGEKDAIFDSLKRGQKLLKDLKVDVETVSKSGDPIEEIVKRAEKTDYDLVVIGAVRKGARGPVLMSAKAYRIIKAVEPPVLVVMGRHKQLKKILVCSGGYKDLKESVETTGKLAKAVDASVTLLHVLVEPPLLYADLIRLEEDVDLLLKSGASLGKKLRREKEAFEKLEVPVDVRLRHGSVIRQIIREIRKGDYDLVVAGSSRYSGKLRSYVMGNITRQIVNRAECPVMVVRTSESIGVRRSLKTFFSEIADAFSRGREDARERKSDKESGAD